MLYVHLSQDCSADGQKMASNSFGLFVQQLSAADDELRVQITYIIYDLLILHDNGQMVSGTLPVSRFLAGKIEADTLEA
jgi:condensin complex subunit 3